MYTAPVTDLRPGMQADMTLFLSANPQVDEDGSVFAASLYEFFEVEHVEQLDPRTTLVEFKTYGQFAIPNTVLLTVTH